MPNVTKQVVFRLPEPLVKKLDAAARAQNRSRNAEAARRLGDSLKQKKVVGAMP